MLYRGYVGIVLPYALLITSKYCEVLGFRVPPTGPVLGDARRWLPKVGAPPIHIFIGGGGPKIGGALSGVPKIRIIVYWGLYWGPLIQGNYH